MYYTKCVQLIKNSIIIFNRTVRLSSSKSVHTVSADQLRTFLKLFRIFTNEEIWDKLFKKLYIYSYKNVKYLSRYCNFYNMYRIYFKFISITNNFSTYIDHNVEKSRQDHLSKLKYHPSSCRYSYTIKTVLFRCLPFRWRTWIIIIRVHVSFVGVSITLDHSPQARIIQELKNLLNAAIR